MSEEFVRKFEEKPKLPARTLPEIRKSMEAVVGRNRHDDSYRTKDEPFNLSALINAVMAWYGTQAPDEQDRIAKLGVDLCNERLRSDVEIPLSPTPSPAPGRPAKKPKQG